MTAWLEILGVGEGELPTLPPVQTVIGPARLRNRVPNLEPWRSPRLEGMLAQIEAHRGTPTLVLASGDPMWFGIGATLAKHLDPGEFRVTPAPSAFQLAAAQLHWPLQHVAAISAHGRPAELIHPHVAPGNRVLMLTTDAGTAPHVARLLVERGYARSILTVLENLGGPAQRVRSAEAIGFDLDCGDFYVLAVDCVADPGTGVEATIPGLPDDIFISDGQLTKREVRAITLARLAPYPGALLWDVGAGCGSVSIEWMRAARDARAIAFEREGERLQMIAVNADRLGVPGIRIENGEAPDSLVGMPTPDAIFLGGGVADETLLHACWTALRRGGRLVANAVTVAAEQSLLARHERLGGELCRIEISHLEHIGTQEAFRPRLPITQWSVTKP